MRTSGRGPLFVLAGAALVPAAALAALTVVARDRAAETPPSTTTPPFVPVPVLVTPLMSVRRAPAVLSVDRRGDVLAAAAAPMLAAVDSSSCAAISLDAGVVDSANPSLAVIPASTLKIVTAAAALDVLGATYTFTTMVRGSAPVDGVVDGDVVLVGGGDPVLSEAWYAQPSAARTRPPRHVTDVAALADAVVAAGVHEIRGRVVPDDSRYDAERYPPSWGPGIAGTADGPPVGALVVDDTTSPSGAIGADPGGAAATLFTTLLRDRGVVVDGKATTTTTTSGAQTLGSVSSAVLTDVLAEMLATSDNLTAEMLVKEIGFHARGTGTREAGLAEIAARLGQWGIPTDGLVLADGSGLSRDNRITCPALLAVLSRGGVSGPIGAGMAVAGEAGTTLDDKLLRDGITGIMRAKTGTLTGVKGLGGFYPAATDEVEFVLLLNGPGAADFADDWNRVADAVLAVAAAPDPAALDPSGS